VFLMSSPSNSINGSAMILAFSSFVSFSILETPMR
jgi:hypothetical protein